MCGNKEGNIKFIHKKRNYINFIHLYSIGTVGVKPNIIFLEDYENFEDL